MFYLTQSKTFLQRAKDSRDTDEQENHLSIAIQMLEKAIEEAEAAIGGNPSNASTCGSSIVTDK